MNKSHLKQQARKHFEAEVIIPKGYSNERNENGLYVQEGLQTAWRNFWNGFEIATENAELIRQFGPKPRHWETTVETIIIAANARNLPDDEAVSIGVWDRTTEPHKFKGIIRYNVGDFRNLALLEDNSGALKDALVKAKQEAAEEFFIRIRESLYSLQNDWRLDAGHLVPDSLANLQQPAGGVPDIHELTERFLTWPLPGTLAAFPGWTGKDLMNYDEAKQMIEYLLSPRHGAPASALSSLPEGYSAIPLSPITGKPKITTAMKAEHMGEHAFTITSACPKCTGPSSTEECEICSGFGIYEQRITVPWETCKRIYQGMAETVMCGGRGKGGRVMAKSKCNCFSEYLDKVKEKVTPQIPEGAADVSIDWQNRVFLLSGGDYAPVNPRVEIEYRKPKKGGGFAKGMTRDTVSVIANYCPFCGRKYEKEGSTDE